MSAVRGVVAKLKKLGLSVSCAESCTGGLLAGEFVSVGGASEVFMGGIVAYDTAVKRSVLGVSESALENGAVSESCAADMAEKARRLFGTDIALSTTGYADKSDRPDVEDGTVFIALAYPGASRVEKTVLKKSRNANRREAVSLAVEMLSGFLNENSCKFRKRLK